MTTPAPSTEDPRLLFVCGSPRSGTTMLGAYIGSGSSVLDLGEYFAFCHVLKEVPRIYARMPTWVTPVYAQSLLDHGRDFAAGLARRDGRRWSLDSTPWNLVFAETLVDHLPDAVWVLAIRGWRGVTQSLARSFASGYGWAGSTLEERVDVWADVYSHASTLARRPVLAVGYDALCADPERVMGSIDDALRDLGVGDSFTPDVLSQRHAPSDKHVAETVVRRHGGRLEWTPRRAYDATAWSAEDEAVARTRAGRVDDDLRSLFPGAFGPDGVHLHLPKTAPRTPPSTAIRGDKQRG